MVSLDVSVECFTQHTFAPLQKDLDDVSLGISRDTNKCLHPISVCLAVGFSSAYLHILRRSSSDSVFRTDGPDLEDEAADTGVTVGGDIVPT
jgi:hypothetical protein